MTTFSLTVDISQWQTVNQQLMDAVANAGAGLLEAVEQTVMNDVSLLSTSLYNVRTGAYAYGWIAEQIDPLSVVIDNSAPYANALEAGWTTRNGGFQEGADVLGQSIYANLAEIGEAMSDWMRANLTL